MGVRRPRRLEVLAALLLLALAGLALVVSADNFAYQFAGTNNAANFSVNWAIFVDPTNPTRYTTHTEPPPFARQLIGPALLASVAVIVRMKSDYLISACKTTAMFTGCAPPIRTATS